MSSGMDHLSWATTGITDSPFQEKEITYIGVSRDGKQKYEGGKLEKARDSAGTCGRVYCLKLVRVD